MTRLRPRRTDREKPDVAGARAELERVRQQRPDVERLVSALTEERGRNNFAANLFGTAHGRQT